jgi:hypothetical protein
MLHNTATNRWHPILFVESPLPGDSKVIRHKSKGHHTEGFATQAAANESAEALATQTQARLLLEDVGEWDGLEVPAAVRFFGLAAEVANTDVELRTFLRGKELGAQSLAHVRSLIDREPK